MTEIQSLSDILILFAWGGLGGLLAGILGIGGGIIYVLIFSYYLERMGMPAAQIVPAIIANSMFAILFAGISGSLKQWRNKNLFPKEIFITGSVSASASILFSYVITTGTWYTKEKFNVFFVVLLILIALRIFLNRKKQEGTEPEKKSAVGFSVTGFISGTVAAFSGIGGGVIIVPIFTDILKIPIRKATSISLGVITVMALATSLFNYFFAASNAENSSVLVFSLALPVAIGSLIASPFGVQLASKMKSEHIRIILFLFLLSVIGKMLFL
jgi:hypothetical protein